jgi:hypothetical protein
LLISSSSSSRRTRAQPSLMIPAPRSRRIHAPETAP